MKIVIFLLILYCFSAIGHSAIQLKSNCEEGLSVANEEMLLDGIISLETELEGLRRYKHIYEDDYFQKFIELEEEISLFVNETLIDIEDTDSFSYEAAKEQIVILYMKINNLKNPYPILRATDMRSDIFSTETDGTYKFVEIQSNHRYKLKNYDGSESILIFSERIIKELTKSKITMAAKDSLVKSAFHGHVRGRNAQGLKLMHTHDGVAFVEVKNIGKVSGMYRLFGCVAQSVIILHFLGREMIKPNDPQRKKNYNICKKFQ